MTMTDAIVNRIASDVLSGIQLSPEGQLDFQYDVPGGMEVPLKKHRGKKFDVYRSKVKGYRMYAAYLKGSVKRHPELFDILRKLKYDTDDRSIDFFIKRTVILMAKFIKPHNIDVVMNVGSSGKLSKKFGKKLALKLGAEFIPDGIFKLGDQNMKQVPTNLRRETKNVFSMRGDVTGKNVLVTDDFVTTRRSFELALENLLPQEPSNVVFATLFRS